ncbi:MAG: tetratricopeptide repeat protein [Gemmatimonadota bacterium]
MVITRTRHLLCALVLVLATGLAYRGSLDNGFTFDDHAIVSGNPALPRQEWGRLASSSYWSMTGANTGLYRPVTMLSLALDERLLGTDPAGFHAVNLALHAAVAVGLYGLASRWLPWAPSCLSALLFALHPALTEAVDSVVGRAELLALGLGLVAVRALWASPRAGLGAAAVGLVALVAAQGAKESAVVLAVALVGAAVAARRRPALWVAPLLAGALATALRWTVTGRLRPDQIGFIDNPLAYVDLPARLASGIGIAIRYGLLLVFPWPLSADYSYDQIRPWHPLGADAVAAALFAASLVAVGLGLVRRSPNGLLWASISLLAAGLVSHLAAPLGTIFAERLVYLPAAGFCLLCGWALAAAVSRPRRQPVAALLACAWLGIGGLLVARRTAEWRDDLSLFAAATRVTGARARSHYGWGLAYQRGGDDEAALAAYDRALAIYPR